MCFALVFGCVFEGCVCVFLRVIVSRPYVLFHCGPFTRWYISSAMLVMFYKYTPPRPAPATQYR